MREYADLNDSELDEWVEELTRLRGHGTGLNWDDRVLLWELKQEQEIRLHEEEKQEESRHHGEERDM